MSVSPAVQHTCGESLPDSFTRSTTKEGKWRDFKREGEGVEKESKGNRCQPFFRKTNLSGSDPLINYLGKNPHLRTTVSTNWY